MSQTNDAAQAAPAAPSTPRTTGGYCSWHTMYSRTAVPVQVVPDEGTASGPLVLYACLPCRRAYDLTPLPDQPQ